MSDLAALIRAKLDAIGEGDDDCRMQCGRSCAEDGYDDVVAALLAVLELHPPTSEVEQEDAYDAAGAFVMSRPRQVVRYDPTIRAIAEALGIEADSD